MPMELDMTRAQELILWGKRFVLFELCDVLLMFRVPPERGPVEPVTLWHPCGQLSEPTVFYQDPY